MAALFDQYPNPLVDLRDVTSAHLEPLLQEETEEWRTELNWDYRPSADLVRRFADMRALTGFTLPGEKEIAGYGYYVCEDGKGLIGGLYVGRRYRNVENENKLLNAILDSMWRTPGTRRVEAQLMMLSSPLTRSMPNPRWFRAFPRKFFEASLDAIRSLPPREPKVAIVPWSEGRQDDAARLIAAAYAGHVDSNINDQYRPSAALGAFSPTSCNTPAAEHFSRRPPVSPYRRRAAVSTASASPVWWRTMSATSPRFAYRPRFAAQGSATNCFAGAWWRSPIRAAGP